MKQNYVKLLIVILSLSVALFLSGCATGGKEATAGPKADNSPKVNPPVVEPGKSVPGQNINPAELKQWDDVKGKILVENYPADITKYLADHKDKETQQAFNINNRTYIVLTMGQMPSAGYQIELKDIVLKDGTLTVFVKYEKPGKNDNVATVITYPTLVIETDDIYEGHYEIQYNIEK